MSCSVCRVQQAERFVAAIAIALYLAAAFLPCETPLASLRAVTQPAPHDVAPSAPVHDHSAHRSGEPASGGHHAAHHAGHGEGQGATGDVPDDVDHSAHHASHSSSTTSAAPTSRRSIQQVQLEFKPTCLCGCSETRSILGGGAARLGSVVPGTVVASLVEAEPIRTATFAPVRMIDIHFDIDPIPI